MFYSVQKLQYYLFLKRFTLLTDHNNLLRIESSEVPKIVRMRIYLQNFQFDVVHIKGKHNVFHDSTTHSEELMAMLETVDATETDAVAQLVAKVHNSRMDHHGVQRTWHFPGHGLPIRVIQDYVACGVRRFVLP